MANYLLDSTVLIDILRGREDVIRRVEALGAEGHRLGICAVNITEVFSGMLERERAAIDRLMSSLLVWEISYESARAAGELRGQLRRRGAAISVPDALVGAVAMASDATLLTANIKDFRIPGLRVEPIPSGN